MKLKPFVYLSFLFYLIAEHNIIPQGKVYLVLGSDTAIWDGMDVSKYHCTYNLDLFTAATSNTAVVMSESFRNQIVDSYGKKLKMTWWMMAGNIFRYATNNNIPINNTMTIHLMKKYYGDKIVQWGDELSLHYHTFAWTDYDDDGKYWWNQAQSFLETKDDLDFTLAQFLLEENVFPVSFRSGWHYMDNDWQHYLNEILPYSLHNDWPAKRFTVTEPIDNVFDWSQSTSEFVPFNPSPDNYQLDGDSKSWNVRSKYMGSVTQQMINDIFLKASQGTDQLACFWSHLPDQNFMNEIQNVNTIVQQVASSYPAVKFQYCTAIEAYKLWRHSNDNLKPDLQFIEQPNGNEVKYLVTTDEPIFQTKPIISVKDRYERYLIAESERIDQNTWRTISSYPINEIGKVGAAVVDTVGNLSTSFIKYLSDDIFIDNGDPQYSEVYGNWNTSPNTVWNLDSRIANLNPGDSAKIRWSIESDYTGLHNIFVQFPQISNHIDTIYFVRYKNGQIKDTVTISISNEFKKWLYVLTADINTHENNFIEMFVKNNGQQSKVFSTDVLKLSAYVRDRQLLTSKQFLDLGEIIVGDTVLFNIEISNAGISELIVDNVFANSGNIEVNTLLPKAISGFNKLNLSLVFIPSVVGAFEDTITIVSNDPINPTYKMPFTAFIQKYFRIVDNDDAGIYSETGTWNKSVAQAYGLSSRYAYLQTTVNGPTATFIFTINKSGKYDIYEILTTTVNSANKALYKIISNGMVIDSFYLNQNEGSGTWKKIGQYYLNKETPISIKVIDSGESTSGPVIRADAFKIVLVEETTDIGEKNHAVVPLNMRLYQNYPNPFNPTTTVGFGLPEKGNVRLSVLNILGEEIKVLLNEEKEAGYHSIEFDGSDLPSSVYFYRIKTDPSSSSGQVFIETKKMVLLK